jgi:hypothetical protein
MDDKATPRPWRDTITRDGDLIIEGRYGERIAYIEDMETSGAEDHANARLIVRAVNSHDALVAVAQQVINFYEGLRTYFEENGRRAMESGWVLSDLRPIYDAARAAVKEG